MQLPSEPLTASSVTPDTLETSLRDRIIEGSLWLVAMRWLLRAAGVVRTVILARLLIPADFGMLGMAMLVVQPMQIFLTFDVHLALIRDVNAGREQFNTAWTLRAMQRLLVALSLFLLAPFVEAYFGAEQLTTVVRVVALAVVVAAFENIGTVSFRKDLDFAKEVTITAAAALVTLCVTVVAAVIFRNYWALIVSVVAERCAITVLSYVYHPYRPWFSLRGVGELWSFSQWIPLQNLGLYIKNSLDSFLVARFFGAASMGLYTMAGNAAGMAAELLAPVTGVLLPGYAKVAHDLRRLAQAYLDALGMLAFLFVPGTVGIVFIAPLLVPVVLGEQWLAAIPIVQALAIYNGVNGLSATVGNVLMTVGRMRRLTVIAYAQVAIYAPVLLLVAFGGGPRAMAVARAAVAVVVAPFLFRAVAPVSSVDGVALGRVLWRPLAASALMAFALITMRSVLPVPGVVALIAHVTVGVTSYAVGAMLLWRLAGRPLGPERTALDWIFEKGRTWRSRRRDTHG